MSGETGAGAEGRARPGEPWPHPERWRMLAVSMAVLFMSLLDVTIVNIALPSMAQDLDAPTSTIQWVVSGYALTFGAMLVTGGRLGDAVGRRPMMLIGLTGFVVGGVAAGLAPSAGVLIAARLVQGLMAGLLVPQNSAIIQTYFRGAERGRAFGLMGMAVGVSSALGPVIGGVIMAAAGGSAGWRWIFLVNVPIGLALLAAVARYMPGRRGDAKADIDLVGAALVGLTVAAVIYPVSTLEHGPDERLVILLAVPVLAWAIGRWERRLRARGRTPVLNLGVLRTVPGYLGGVLIGSLYFTGFTGVLLVYSVHLQSALGMSPLVAALHLTPLAVTSAISAPLSGRLVTRFGRRTTVAALGLTILGIAASAVLVPAAQDPTARSIAVLATLAVTGLGAGAVVSPNLALALADVPVPMAGSAGGALQTGQRMGNAVGAALMLAVYEVVTTSSGDAATGLRGVLLASVAVLGLALLAAVRDLRHGHRPPA